MLATAWLMASHSYEKGISPIPIFTLEQFLMFPLFDLVGIVTFYLLAICNTDKPQIHKHSMLICSIAIMDPALARLGAAIGIAPIAVLFHIGLVVLVIVHDRRSQKHIHFVTWMGLAYVIIRPVLTLTFGTTDTWASIVQSMFE